MNHLFVIISILAFGIMIIALSSVDAQLDINKEVDNDTNKKFLRLQFTGLLLERDLMLGDTFIRDLDKESIKHKVKDIPQITETLLFCHHETLGRIYLIKSAFVFEDNANAHSIGVWLKNNIPFNKITYGEYYLTENTHHWKTPQPDKIIDEQIYGNQTIFNQISFGC